MAAPESGRTAREVSVRGRVQGVSFRYHCAREAERLGVDGWVRNERDGTVTAHFEGPSDAVSSLVDWCRSGPPAADVAHLEARPVEPVGITGFQAS